MAEGDENTDKSQKTEDPTARKLEEAHKRGQVIQSREVNNWLMLFAGTLVVGMAGPGLMTAIKDRLKVFFELAHALPTDPVGLRSVVADLLLDIGAIMALPFLAFMFTGFMSGFVQVGPLFTPEPMKPSLSKISPIKGFERLFSLRSIVEFLKGVAKLVIIFSACLMVLYPYFGGVEHFVGQEFTDGLHDLRMLFIRMMAAALGILFVVAILDYMYQRYDFLQKMMMSKQEIKEEFKQTEGDPHVKGKLRQLREQRARQRMMQAVPEADVVITNPTHYAIALKYDTLNMDAPVLVAKGADAVAERIRALAKENKVPLVENPPLARALFDSMELGQMIPPEHFKAVAEVISYVFRLKGRKL
jgi:flagellar biosynthetic protein FlhB